MKNKKRWISILLCFAMLFGILPVNAFADTTATSAQIGKYYKANDTTGILESSPTLNADQITKSYANDMVTTKKTISPGTNENEFNIELEVQTQEKIENIEESEDAVAVIVIDMSTSMANAAILLNSRLNVSKAAAVDFIRKFADTKDSKAVRKIAVVGFNGKAGKNKPAAETYVGWENASPYSLGLLRLRDMASGGGTCLEAGLVLAKNLLNDPSVKDIKNKNIIILSDGNPTYYLSDDAKKDTSTKSIGTTTQTLGNGGKTTHYTHTETEKTVKTILQDNINIYGVYVGSDEVDCVADDMKKNECELKKTGGNWLRQNCGMIAYSLADWNDLSKVFQDISELIALRATAWITEDPIDSHFVFNDFAEESSNLKEYSYDQTDKTVYWNLKVDQPYTTRVDNGVTTYIYKLEYSVKLDTLQDGYTAGTYYPTNGVTSVYYIVETNSSTEPILKGYAYFNVPSVKGYDANKTFKKVDEFDNPLPGATFTLTTTDDTTWSRTATSDANGEVEFKDIPSGHTYTVIETTAPDNYIKDNNEYSLTVEYGNVSDTIGNANDVVTNTIKKGDLKISKTVTGEGADSTQEFGFTVQLTNTTSSLPSEFETDRTTGSNLPLDNNNKLTFTLKGGESLTIQGIPVGTSYTVTETPVANYAASATGASGTISETMAVAAFTNHYSEPEPDKGQLQITKKVEGITTTQAFTFTVTLQDKDGKDVSGKYNGNAFTSGNTITLKSGDIATISDIPVGTCYTVTEAADTNYDTTWSNETGTITKDATAEVTCTNTIKKDSLTVSKTVAGTGANTNEEFTFEVEVTLPNGEAFTGTHDGVTFTNGKVAFTLKDGESQTITGIPVGSTYEVTETANDAYTTTKSGDTGTIAVGGNATAAFKNTLNTSSLTVTKAVTGEKTAPTGDTFTFNVTVTMPNNSPLTGNHGGVTFGNDGKATFTLKAGESQTITGIPVGSTYTVTEEETNADYTYDTAKSGTIPVTEATTTVTNKYDPQVGDLKITKTVEGEGAPENDEFTFTVKAWNGAVAMADGTYNAERNAKDATSATDFQVTFTDGKATVTLKDGEEMTIKNLPAGITCNVKETPKDNYTVNYVDGVADGYITVGRTTSIDFVNTYTTPENEFNFTIEKVVEKAKTGEIAPTGEKTFNFVVSTSSDKDNEAAILQNSTITVDGVGTESTSVSVKTTSSSIYIWEVAGNETGWTYDNHVETITPNTTKVTFTNFYYEKEEQIPEYGSLFVKKLVLDPNNEITTAQEFGFTITAEDLAGQSFDAEGVKQKAKFNEYGKLFFWLKDKEYLKIFGIPAGTEYKVTEDDYSDEYTTTIDEITTNETTGTITTSSSVLFVNTKTTTSSAITTSGSLIVTKTVSGSVSTTEEFHFTVTASVDDGTYGDMTFKDGVAKITLKAGQSKIASDLPVGTVVYVTEDESDDYTVTVNGEESGSYEGMIEDATSVTVTFNNHKDKTDGGNSSVDSYGKITIRKTVTGDNAPAEDIAYAFTAWVRNSNGNAVSEKVSYKIVKADGTIAERGNLTIDKDGYRFYLKDGESITFGNITSGRRVAVQEITTGDFITTSTGLTDGVCMISANRTKTVEFVNDYSNTETPIDPEEPKDPIDPTEPTQPATPAAPEEPTPSDTSFDDVPKTGDETGIGLWIAIACLTLSGMAALAFGRKRFGTR